MSAAPGPRVGGERCADRHPAGGRAGPAPTARRPARPRLRGPGRSATAAPLRGAPRRRAPRRCASCRCPVRRPGERGGPCPAAADSRPSPRRSIACARPTNGVENGRASAAARRRPLPSRSSPHRGDEPVAAAVHGRDHARGASSPTARRAAVDALRQHRLAHHLPRPHGVEQLVLRHHALAMAHAGRRARRTPSARRAPPCRAAGAERALRRARTRRMRGSSGAEVLAVGVLACWREAARLFVRSCANR